MNQVYIFSRDTVPLGTVIYVGVQAMKVRGLTAHTDVSGNHGYLLYMELYE